VSQRAITGQQAEQRACDYLLGQGLKLVARNFNCARGELDLVMDDRGTLVFVEVRCRRDAGYGNAAESVDARKQARLIAAAQIYLQQHPRAAQQPCRFDVLGLTPDDDSRIHWIRDAFQP
jgi:putative endonuclease